MVNYPAWAPVYISNLKEFFKKYIYKIKTTPLLLSGFCFKACKTGCETGIKGYFPLASGQVREPT